MLKSSIHKCIVLFLLVVVSTMIFNSCHLHYGKRRYNKGYYVHFSKNKSLKLTNNNPKNEDVKKHLTDYTPVSADLENIKSDLHLNKNEPVYSNTNNKNNKYPITADLSASQKQNTQHTTPVTQQKYYEPADVHLELSKTQKNNYNNLLYSITALMGALSFGLIRSNKERVLKYTRWAHKNKKKTKIGIWLMQTAILLSGFYIGKGSHHLGYNFTDSVEYVLGGVTALSFGTLFSVKFLKNPVTLLQFFIKKFIFLLMTLSFFASSVVIGNKVSSEQRQISPMGHTMVAYDYVANATLDSVGINTNPEEEVNETLIGVGIFFLVLLCIVLFAIMVVGSCATICLLLFTSENPTLFWAALGALVIVVLATWGLIETIKYIKQLSKKTNH